jgi:hypothetical protein
LHSFYRAKSSGLYGNNEFHYAFIAVKVNLSLFSINLSAYR